jgi:ribose transport system permease protein
VKRLLSDYGSLLVLLLLCAYYSVITWTEQQPVTPAAGRALADRIIDQHGASAAVVIIVRDTRLDAAFAAALAEELTASGVTVLETVTAEAPVDARRALVRLAGAHPRIDAVATNDAASKWGPLQPDSLSRLAAENPALANTKVHKPASYNWPTFLTRENLLNIVNQNADIAIIAIGMTLVIITRGIDLSVGSVLAVSAVLSAIAIQALAGGAQANMFAVAGCCLLAIAACALCGLFNGAASTMLQIPPFVVTLAMMMIARGLALIAAVAYRRSLSGGTSATPEAIRVTAGGFDESGQPFGFAVLSNGTLLGVPNPIWLMLALYLLFHVVMTRTILGRRIYAVGGNPEAARLSGIRVQRVIIFVYVLCAALAGLAGIVDASRFVGGRPNAGELYELQVIAAVVVGGTSLSGGEGRILGTLIGAMIIAVIQNGLNMAGVTPYEQMVIFGALIFAAALLDQLKKRLWRTAV